MNRPCYSTILLLCSTFFLCAHAQEYNYAHYTKKDGLAGETVYEISQDHNGFLWFGTETGLSRFDGKKFRNFTTADGLPSNEVFSCIEDQYKRLWIFSFSNQVCYYKDGKIYNKYNDTLLKKLSFNGLTEGLIINKKEHIIIWDNTDILFEIDTHNHVTRYSKKKYRIGYELLKPSKYGILMSLLKGFPAAEEERAIKLLGISPDLKAKIGVSLAPYDQIIFSWSSYPIKAVIWNRKKKEGVKIRNGDIVYRQLLGTEDGLAVHYREGGACVYNYVRQKEIVKFLSNYIVKGIYRDREDNLWFSTVGNGVFKLSNTKALHYQLNNHTFPIQFIINSKTGLLAGIHDSCWRIIPSHKTDSNAYAIPVYQKEKVKMGFEWYVENTKGCLVNINNPPFPFKTKREIGYIKTTHTIGNSILIATSSGAVLYTYKGNYFNYDTIYRDRATTAIRQGTHYYIGTLEGLVIADKNYRIVSRIIPYHISHMAPCPDGGLWVATYNKGVFKVRNGIITDSISKKGNNLNSDFCRCVYIDGDYLWIGTDQGLNKVRVGNGRAVTELIYTTANGLSSNEVNAICVRDSILYAGTPKGLDLINKNIRYPRPLLNLVFTGMAASGKGLSADSAIILPHGNNNIKFDFAAISFSLESITYRYRLTGLSDSWQDVTEPSLNFISLPSGKYKLQVQAVSPLGYASNVIEKEFEVKKAVFEQWWFWWLLTLFIAGIMLLVIQYRTSQIKKKAAEKNNINIRMAELEQMALRAQINPHFIFNCLNSVQNYILKQDVKGVNYYLSQFAALIRKTLDNSPKVYITLAEEISYLNTYISLERLQLKYPFEYTIVIDEAIQPARILFPNMLLQPFVENAVKHALRKLQQNGRLDIRFSKISEDFLLCCIEDNGPGIEHTVSANGRSHQSKGIHLTEKRIETLNLISNESAKIALSFEDRVLKGGKGTKISIYVPIQYTNLFAQ